MDEYKGFKAGVREKNVVDVWMKEVLAIDLEWGRKREVKEE